ncbi:MAG: prolipoprotein diacylglyceryl transferase [Ktedonobacteraceae bacterium]|nr:prolipoprotein diacylglyceryl transferase [Ktedonobacteraceae bacterium]
MYPPVNPILVQLGPFALHWYGVIMTLAIFLGATMASRYLTRHGYDGSTVWDMLLWVLIPAIIGARLYYVFIQSPRGPTGLGRYLADPIEILQVWRGGIHIYGALIFGCIALLAYLRIHKLPYLRYLDGIVLGLALGQVIGRLGNFINQELYGPPTTLPWGLRIDPAHRLPPYDDLQRYPESVRFHPLFLYEMLWDAVGFALLLWISRRFEKQLRAGDLFLLYLIWIPLGRFFIEFLRTDSWFFPGTPFNILHVIIAIIVITAAVVLFLRHRSQPTTAMLQNTPSAGAGDAELDGEEISKHEEEVTTSESGSEPGSVGIES